MSVFLLEHPPKRRQFHSPRRRKPSGVVVVHTAEGSGANAVADFIRGRGDPGSYHDLVDDRRIVSLVRYTDEAFQDGTGTNPHAYAVSFATFASRWPRMTSERREAYLLNGARAVARYARWLQAEHGITVPARRISRPESARGVPGFISHGERDPSRRSDPGPQFPWARFLALFAAEMQSAAALVASSTVEPEEEQVRPFITRDPRNGDDCGCDGFRIIRFGDRQQAKSEWCRLVNAQDQRIELSPELFALMAQR